MSEEKRQLIRVKPPTGGGRPALPRKMTRIEKSCRKMLADKKWLEVNNNIRLSNFTEVRLYDRLIGRDVDKMTREYVA